MAARHRLGLTQVSLSRRSGVSLKYISMIESGTNPSMKTLLKLCQAMGVDIVDVIDRAANVRVPTRHRRRVCTLHATAPSDCPVFRKLMRYIEKLDRHERERALRIIKVL